MQKKLDDLPSSRKQDEQFDAELHANELLMKKMSTKIIGTDPTAEDDNIDRDLFRKEPDSNLNQGNREVLSF